MKAAVAKILDKMLETVPDLEVCRESTEKAFRLMRECYLHNGKVLVCGNGGSAADSEHIVGELMKGFLLKRKISETDRKKIISLFPMEGDKLAAHLQGSLPAISLVNQISLSSAFINDVAPDMVFAQQVYGYAKPGDVLVGLSTSGNSKNVIHAIMVAKALGVHTIGMTGENGETMKALCDVCICVPAAETYRVQEYHLPVYHALCAMLEAEFFAES